MWRKAIILTFPHLEFYWRQIAFKNILLSYLLTYLLTYLLHGAETFLRI